MTNFVSRPSPSSHGCRWVCPRFQRTAGQFELVACTAWDLTPRCCTPFNFCRLVQAALGSMNGDKAAGESLSNRQDGANVNVPMGVQLDAPQHRERLLADLSVRLEETAAERDAVCSSSLLKQAPRNGPARPRTAPVGAPAAAGLCSSPPTVTRLIRTSCEAASVKAPSATSSSVTASRVAALPCAREKTRRRRVQAIAAKQAAEAKLMRLEAQPLQAASLRQVRSWLSLLPSVAESGAPDRPQRTCCPGSLPRAHRYQAPDGPTLGTAGTRSAVSLFADACTRRHCCGLISCGLISLL